MAQFDTLKALIYLNLLTVPGSGGGSNACKIMVGLEAIKMEVTAIITVDCKVWEVVLKHAAFIKVLLPNCEIKIQ